MAWLKRLSAPIAGGRKSKGKFTVSPRGPHKKSASLPLLVALRDRIMLAANTRESKGAIKRRELLVDGNACKDEKFGLGLMDTVSIPEASLFYRVMPERKGLKLLRIEKKESAVKICKIIGKTAVNGGKIQYNLHDGRNIIADNIYKAGDSLVIELPSQKIAGYLKFEKGAAALVTNGKNAGTVATIERIETDGMKRIWLKKGEEIFETAFGHVMAVGKDKPAFAVE